MNALHEGFHNFLNEIDEVYIRRLKGFLHLLKVYFI